MSRRKESSVEVAERQDEEREAELRAREREAMKALLQRVAKTMDDTANELRKAAANWFEEDDGAAEH